MAQWLTRWSAPRFDSVRVYSSVALATVNNTSLPVPFNTARFNDNNLWVVGAPTRLTVQRAGLYLIGGSLEFAPNASGLIRQSWIRMNGSVNLTWQSDIPVSAIHANRLSIDTLYRMAVADYVELIAFQDSGGALNVTAAPSSSPEFWMVRLAD